MFEVANKAAALLHEFIFAGALQGIVDSQLQNAVPNWISWSFQSASMKWPLVAMKASLAVLVQHRAREFPSR